MNVKDLCLRIRQPLMALAGEGEGKLAVHITEQPPALVVAVVLNRSREEKSCLPHSSLY
jgi:hypothetical protein